ncbi:MAG: HEAT repeat domain-containing protein [Planctomycetota bacterium]|nr:HEAT repeat domain-containing protein [Planctomycetota bacterium]
MVRLILGLVICVVSLASIAYLSLWDSKTPPSDEILSSARVSIAGSDPISGTRSETPGAKEIAPAASTFTPPTATPPAKRARPKRPTSLDQLGRHARAGKVSTEDLLWKLEEAIKGKDARAARELTRDLIRAIRDGSMKADAVADRLVGILKGLNDTLTLQGVIPQLGFLKSKKMTQFFQEQYWATQDLQARQMYLNAMRQSVDESSIDFLRQVLETEERQNLRNQALFALSRIGDHGGLAILEETAQSGSGVDQVTALRLLSNRKDANYVPLFEQVLSKPDSSRSYETAIRALQSVGSSSSVPALESVIDNPNVSEYIQNLARVAIRQINQREQGGKRSRTYPVERIGRPDSGAGK